MTRAGAGKKTFVPHSLYARRRGEVNRGHFPGDCECVNDIGNTVGTQHRRAFHEMKMQVRGGSVPRIPHLAQNLAAFHAIAHSYPNRPLLEMSVKANTPSPRFITM
jgi:hypothetical protein